MNLNQLYCDLLDLQQKITIIERRIFTIEQGGGGSDECVAVIITDDLSPVTLTAGQSLYLAVSVKGTPPFTYQWYKNTVPIDGAVSFSYFIGTTVEEDSGLYSVHIINECGEASSAESLVTVNQSQLFTTAYWGWVDDINDIVIVTDITSLQHSNTFLDGGTIEADFTENTDPKILVMAENIDQPEKTKWYASPNNNGDIGGTGNLMPTPIVISSYRVYYTNYPTQQNQTTIQYTEL